MDEFAKVLFKNAAIKEQVSYKKYIDFRDRAKIEPLKDLFTNLANEELIHERLFNKMDLSVLKIVNNSKLKDINLFSDNNLNVDHIKNQSLENLQKVSKNDESINSALNLAITDEQKAILDYELLFNHLDFGESRDVLKEIIHQEKRHKTLLEKAKLNFNHNDWNMI